MKGDNGVTSLLLLTAADVFYKGRETTVQLLQNQQYVGQADLLNNRDALIARDARYSRIGRFQGGDEMIMNRWRSEKISCMIDNRQYFSAWQRELIVKRIMSLAGESFSLSDFFNLDVTLDPVRDSGGAGAPEPDGWKSEACAECGPLAPPEQIDKNAYGIPQPDCRPM